MSGHGWMSLAEAVRAVPIVDGHRVDKSTLWRWCRHGVRRRDGSRVRLQHGRVGRRLVTTRPWIDAFIAACGAAEDEAPAPEPEPDTPRRYGTTSAHVRRREIAAAEREVAAMRDARGAK